MNPEPIPVSLTDYDLTDPAIYQWRIWNPKRNIFLAMFMLISMALVIPAIPFGILYAVQFLSATLATWLAWSALVVAITVDAVLLFICFTGTREERIKNSAGIVAVATFAIGVVHYLLVFTEPAGSLGYKNTEGATGWTWAIYLVDNLMGVLLLDIPDVYNWHISSIRPETNFACFLTVLVRLFMTIGLVEMVLSIYRSELSESSLLGTVRECVYHCDSLVLPADLLLMRTGTIAPTTNPAPVRLKEFIETLKPKLT